MKPLRFVLSICLICLTSFSLYAQEIESIHQAGNFTISENDRLKAFHQDDDGNFYLMIRTAGDTIDLFGSAVPRPTSISVNQRYFVLAKLDQAFSVQWVNHIPVNTFSSFNLFPGKMTTDSDGNLYAGIDAKLTTYKFDAAGNEVWSIPIIGKKLQINDNNQLDLIGILNTGNSVLGFPISNRFGTVFTMDLDGNYVSHFTVDDSSWGREELRGLCELGYFGLRRQASNPGNLSRLELCLYDANGMLLANGLINYNRDITARITYDSLNNVFYVGGFFTEMEPINADPPSFAGAGNFFNILQFDEELNFSRRVRMGGPNSIGTTSANFTYYDFTTFKGDLFFGTKIWNNQQISHLGIQNPFGLQDDVFMFAKLDRNLTTKWYREMATASGYNDLLRVIATEDAIYFAGAAAEINENGNLFQANAYNDVFVTKLIDQDASSASLTGRIFLDLNQNGVDDEELGLPYRGVVNQQLSALQYSNSDGRYQTGLVTGTNTIKLFDPLPAYWMYSTPDSLLIEVTENDSLIDTGDFGIYPIPGIRDVSVELSAMTALRPGFEVVYKLTYQNNINDTLSGQIFFHQDSVLFFENASDSPDAFVGDSVVWNYADLKPGESRDIIIYDSLAADENLVGTIVNAYASLTPLVNDIFPVNNRDTIGRVVTAALDPNEIRIFPRCVQEDFAATDGVFEYEIHFQNLGNDTAFQVLIVDQIPDSFLMNSFELIASSHPTSISILDRELKFFFDQIKLPYASIDEFNSQGFVRFKIKLDPAVQELVNIKNRAAIYFDYNSPVITNEIAPSIGATSSIIDISSCSAFTSYSGNQLWTSSGVYLDTFPLTSEGCLETVTVNFSLTALDNSVSTQGNALTANATGLNYQWINCATNEIIPGANSLDFIPNSLGTYAVEISTTGCLVSSDCITIDSSFGLDQDNDGFFEWADCDDTNEFVNPVAVEVPYNGIDEDCNAMTLDDDLDGDGFVLADDCDDTNAQINPNAVEVPYNGIDEDCNAMTLDDDLDGDGFVLADDCDDTNAQINPNAVEVPYNGIDEDCNAMTLDDDLDGDGFVLADDCDDTNAQINPNAVEVPYNGIDEDCNAMTLDDDLDGDGFVLADDCDDTNAQINPNAVEVPYNGIDEDCNAMTLDDDLDGDGFVLADDCDDTNAQINPNAVEVPYNGIDEDCNAMTLDDDLDGDGFVLADDCDDTNAQINPNAVEISNNGIDEDCDGMDLITSTFDVALMNFELFPNPASDQVFIQYSYPKDLNLEITDLNGRVYFQQQVKQKIRIDITTYPAGVYFVQLTDGADGDARHYIKFVKL